MRRWWQQGSLYLTVMSMEGCTLYFLLAAVIQPPASDTLSAAGLMLIVPLAFLVNKMLRWLKFHAVFRYLIDVLTWAIALLLAAKVQLFAGTNLLDSTWLAMLNHNFWQGGKAELILFFAGIILWFAGERLSRIRIDFAACVGEFQFSIAILLITLFAISQLDITIAGSISLVIVFALSALLALSLAHAQEGSGWLSGLNRGPWAGLLLASIGLILVLGLMVSAALTPGFIQLLIDVVTWLWNRAMAALLYLLTLLPVPSGEFPPVPPPDTTTEAEISNAMKEFFPESLRNALRVGWTILASGALLAALWRVSTQIADWLRRHMANRSKGEVESLSGAFRADILGFLKRIIARLFGFGWIKSRQTAAQPIDPVRQVYRQLLKWAAGEGFPRSSFQTPYEYLTVLRELKPAAVDGLSYITRQYVNTRYGLAAPSPEELATLRETWQQVKQGGLKPGDRASPH